MPFIWCAMPERYWLPETPCFWLQTKLRARYTQNQQMLLLSISASYCLHIIRVLILLDVSRVSMVTTQKITRICWSCYCETLDTHHFYSTWHCILTESSCIWLHLISCSYTECPIRTKLNKYTLCNSYTIWSCLALSICLVSKAEAENLVWYHT